MKYSELESLQKQHVNGVLSQFMDSYIRTHLIWTPEQMYEALYEMIDQQHKEGYYGGRCYINGRWEEPYTVGNTWITTPDAKDSALLGAADRLGRRRLVWLCGQGPERPLGCPQGLHPQQPRAVDLCHGGPRTGR